MRRPLDDPESAAGLSFRAERNGAADENNDDANAPEHMMHGRPAAELGLTTQVGIFQRKAFNVGPCLLAAALPVLGIRTAGDGLAAAAGRLELRSQADDDPLVAGFHLEELLLLWGHANLT